MVREFTANQLRPDRSDSGTSHTRVTTQAIFRDVSDLLPVSPVSQPADSRQGIDVERYTARLKLLNEIHVALTRPMTLEDLLSLILGRVFSHLHPDEAIIYLRDSDGSFKMVRSLPFPTESNTPFHSESLLREIVEKRLGALAQDAQTDSRFFGAESIKLSGVRSVLAVPLLDFDDAFGAIVLTSSARARQFSEEDLELLASVAAIAALRIRNISLAREASEKRNIEDDLARAREIQLALLGNTIPEILGYSVFGSNRPFRAISGDFYEVFDRRGGHESILLVADVSGKGIAASLLTASLGAFSATSIEQGLPADEICIRVSRMLYSRTPPSKYATAFLGVLAPATGVLRYVNAGHNPPLLVKANLEVSRLPTTGPPLGLLPDATYVVMETQLDEGDLLLIYTDGLTEALNDSGEEYGIDRLEELCRKYHSLDLPVVAGAIENQIYLFTNSAPASDDRTVLLLRRLRRT